MIEVVRSLMFVPGGRPALLAKVARCRPDVVVVDLEDAVAPVAKPQARAAALAALAEQRPGARVVLVRINPPGTPWHADDLAAVAGAAADGVIDGVVLPKYERTAELEAVRAALPSTAGVVVGLESVRGVLDAVPLLAAGPDAVYFGAEDLIAELGGRRSVDGAEVLAARSQVRMAAHLHRVPAVDQAVVAVHDLDRFRADAERARDLGFRGKICLHPEQVRLAHEVFTPTEEQVAHARAVTAAAADGVGMVAGQMVDAVHVAMARGVLATAAQTADGSVASERGPRC